MPNYDIRDKLTGEIVEKTMSVAQLKQFLEDNVNHEIVFLSMNVGDPVYLGVKKPPTDFLKYVINPINLRNKSKKDLRYRAPREI